jgi:hypothetical protein
MKLMLNIKIVKPDRLIISCLSLFVLTFVSYSLALNRVYAASCQSPAVTYINGTSLKSLSS